MERQLLLIRNNSFGGVVREQLWSRWRHHHRESSIQTWAGWGSGLDSDLSQKLDRGRHSPRCTCKSRRRDLDAEVKNLPKPPSLQPPHLFRWPDRLDISYSAACLESPTLDETNESCGMDQWFQLWSLEIWSVGLHPEDPESPWGSTWNQRNHSRHNRFPRPLAPFQLATMTSSDWFNLTESKF